MSGGKKVSTVDKPGMAGSVRLHSRVLEHLGSLVMVLDTEGRIVYANRDWERYTGCSMEDAAGRPVWDLGLLPETTDRFKALFADLRPDQFPFKTESCWRTRDGEKRWLALSNTAASDSGGEVELVVVSGFDITWLKQAEEQLKHLSLHDPVTGLYNRAYFEEEMRRLEDGRYNPVGIILCDIDGLKLVNDTLGHDAGDSLLAATARLIRQCFRKSDIIARIGGDEFAVLLPNSSRPIVAEAYQRIMDSVAVYNEGQPPCPMSISVGFAVTDRKPAGMSRLFKEADSRMYQEKLKHSQAARDSVVAALMKSLETKDFLQHGHAERLQSMAVGLARAAGFTGGLNDLRRLAQFHDLGKVGIYESLLFKPGPLDSEERLEVQRHCEIGRRIALSVPDLAPIADLILKHHEWWNGEGYPLGLKGKAIPLECRILAVVEAYEVMTAGRPYRQPKSHEAAVEELKRGAGTQFDPHLVDRFIRWWEKKNRCTSQESEPDEQLQLSLPFINKF